MKSSWQPLPQPSVALENYLQRTKLEIANLVFSDTKDNLTAKQKQTFKALNANSDINLKKADKGTTTVVIDTANKEGYEQVSLTIRKFYKPLEEPIVSQTAA